MDERTIYWIVNTLKSKLTKGFFGSVTFVFQDGRLQVVKTEQTIKPPSSSIETE